MSNELSVDANFRSQSDEFPRLLDGYTINFTVKGKPCRLRFETLLPDLQPLEVSYTEYENITKLFFQLSQDLVRFLTFTSPELKAPKFAFVNGEGRIFGALGMKVFGEISDGEIIAVTKQLCVYRLKNGDELAEPWEQILFPSTPENEMQEFDLKIPDDEKQSLLKRTFLDWIDRGIFTEEDLSQALKGVTNA